MKRATGLISFAMLGLLSTWSTLFIVTRIDARMPLHLGGKSEVSCGDIEHCDISAFHLAQVFILLMTPTVMHAVVGFRIARNPICIRKLLLSYLTLWAATFVFYAAWMLVVRGSLQV